MKEIHGVVVGYLQGAYVVRVEVRGQAVDVNHRPVDAAERELMRASLRRATPIVVELSESSGEAPIRVRKPSRDGSSRRESPRRSRAS